MGSPPPTIDEFNQMRRVDDGGLSESDVEDIDPLLVCALKQIHEEGEAGYVAPAVAKAAVAAASTASASASSATNAPAKLPDDGSAIALSTESTSTSTSTSASASSTDSSSESTSSSTPSTSTSSSSVDAHSPPSALTPEASVYALTVLNGREETEGAKMRKLRRAEHEEKIKKDTPEFTQLYESLLKSIGSRTITPVLHHDSLTPSPHGFLLSHGLSVAASPLARPPRPQDTALVNTLGTTSSVAPLPDGFAATSTMGYVLGFMHDSESISRKERLDLLVQDPHFRALGQSLATFFPDSERIVNNIAESYLSLTERMQVDTSVELAYSGGGSVQGCYPTAVTVCDDMVAVGGRSSGPGQADAIHRTCMPCRRMQVFHDAIDYVLVAALAIVVVVIVALFQCSLVVLTVVFLPHPPFPFPFLLQSPRATASQTDPRATSTCSTLAPGPRCPSMCRARSARASLARWPRSR